MAGKLITLPFRVWFKSARLLTHLAGEAAGRAISLAGQTIGASSPDRSGAPESAQAVAEPPLEPSPAPAPPSSAQPESARISEEPADISEEPAEILEEPAAIPEEPPDIPEAEPAYTADAEPAYTAEAEPAYTADAEPAYVSEEPAHVSEEPELVREEAEPGAEDGAGAAVTVAEPWHGYARMNARDIIDRAQEANAAELAAVRLYEARHRGRQTVLAAVDRQLKLGDGGNPA